MKFKVKPEQSVEHVGARYYNLKIRANSISPCTILWDYKQKNQVFWKGKELQSLVNYWFSLNEIVPQIGDRFEIVTSHKEIGEVLKVSTLEVIDLKGSDGQKGLRAVEIARWDSRDEEGATLKTECEVCPTCKRKM